MTPLRRFPRTSAALAFVILAVGGLFWWQAERPAGEEPLVQLSPGPTSLPSAQAGPAGSWAAVAAAAGPSGVAVQAFQGGRLIRSGFATVVSSDGLVVTVSEAAPLASPAASFQVATPDGRLLQTRVVARDGRVNLVLMKVVASDLTISPLAVSRPPAGSELALVGGFMQLSGYTASFAHAWVAHSFPSYLVLDAVPGSVQAGSRAIGADGRQDGIVFVRNGQVRMIPADIIGDFVDSYLQTTAPNR